MFRNFNREFSVFEGDFGGIAHRAEMSDDPRHNFRFLTMLNFEPRREIYAVRALHGDIPPTKNFIGVADRLGEGAYA